MAFYTTLIGELFKIPFQKLGNKKYEFKKPGTLLSANLKNPMASPSGVVQIL